jgi:hypothetical protein
LVALLLVLLLGASASASAAEFSVQSQVDAQRLGVDDQIQLTITVSGPSVDEIPIPALTNLNVVGGPFTSSQVSFINGAVSQSRSNTYVLQPQSPGKAEVGAVQVRAGNDVRTAPAIPIEVVAGSILQRQRQAPANPFDPFGGEDPLETMLRGRRRSGPPPDPKIFIEAAVNRNRVHVGEPVLLTYYLYTQTSVKDIQATEAPQYPGLWPEDLERPKQLPSGEAATANGENYRRFAIIQKLLYPMRAGTLTIPPMAMRLTVQQGGGFFEPGGGIASVERSTKPITITALPIPETPGFSGAVGRFTASATLDKDTVAIGDAATLRFEVKGEGNLKWVDKAPELVLTGVKVYPPQVKSDLKTSPSGIAGTKTWEMILVPQTGGMIEIPALRFTYFDPATGQLTTAETHPLELHAQGTAPSTAAGAAAAAVPVATNGNGPLALRSDLDRPASLIPPLGGHVLAGALALTLLAHAGFFATVGLRQWRRSASGRPAPGRDVRRALAELARAEHDGLSKEAAVALIERTLHEVFGPLEEGTGADTEREQAARQVLQDVHFIRYAPQLGDYSEKIREVARRAEDVVRRYA